MAADRSGPPDLIVVCQIPFRCTRRRARLARTPARHRDDAASGVGMNEQGLEHLALGADTPKELNHAAMVRLLLRAQLQVFEKVAPQLEAGAILGQLQTQLGVLLATGLPRLRNEVEEHRPEELAL